MSPTNRQIPKRYSPVRRSSACIATPVTARLACVRHAASVQSEPGSNSSLKGFETFNLTKRYPKKLYWLILETHRRSWLRQQTDASPHTSYLLIFKERCRCAVARQKRNFKLLLSFRQPPRFSFRGDQLRPNQLPRSPFFQPASAARWRILLSVFLPSTPSNFLFSRCRRPVNFSFFAARLSTGARCEGGASYCLITGRQHPWLNFFRMGFDGGKHGYFFATSKPCFVAAA